MFETFCVSAVYDVIQVLLSLHVDLNSVIASGFWCAVHDCFMIGSGVFAARGGLESGVCCRAGGLESGVCCRVGRGELACMFGPLVSGVCCRAAYVAVRGSWRA